MKKLDAFLSQFGISLSGEKIERFERYLDMLVETNKQINLTTITNKEDIINKHFIDSLSVLYAFKAPEALSHKKIIDIGSGAGFPGIPLKIVFPNINLTLVDSVQKKVTFLQTVVEQLSLSNTTCLHARAEVLGQQKEFREQYDIALARAVAESKVLTEYTLPFVRPGGVVVFYKSKKASEEIAEAKKAIALLGGSLRPRQSFSIGDFERTLLVVEKIKPTPPLYPRKEGTPKKNPL